MSALEIVKYNFDKVGYVTKLIKKWVPTECKTEKDFEKSLYKFLHEELPSIQITKQYAKGRIKADIAIQNDIIIELKNNLTSRSSFQRLIGQLYEYKDWEEVVILVLIGNTETAFIKDIKKFIKEETDYTFLVGVQKFILIEKKL